MKYRMDEFHRILRQGGKFLFIATKNSFMGKLVAATWRNKVLDPVHVRECMERAGIGQVETLRLPWYFKTVDAAIMALLGEFRPAQFSDVYRRRAEAYGAR